MNSLEVNNLKKSFRSDFLWRTRRVLKDVTIRVGSGEIYGFLGPNGAGKTTTIKCIIGLLFPDSGEILIHGHPAGSRDSRRRVGFLPENPYFYDYLTARELLLFTGQIFSMPPAAARERASALLRQVGLEGNDRLLLRKFSKGMLQRAGLAQALMQDPDVLILDEPFSGLDPIGRKELRQIILDLRAGGKTVFFSSHILQDMEAMVDRVGIILNGAIRREGRLSELISHSVRYWEITCVGIGEAELARIPAPATARDGQFILRVEAEEELNAVIEGIIHNNGRVLAVTPAKMSLEDIFLNELRESA